MEHELPAGSRSRSSRWGSSAELQQQQQGEPRSPPSSLSWATERPSILGGARWFCPDPRQISGGRCQELQGTPPPTILFGEQRPTAPGAPPGLKDRRRGAAMLPSDPDRSRREAAAVFLFLSCRQKNLRWASERLSSEVINPGLPATLSYALLQGLRPSPPAHLLGLSTAVAPHPIPASTRRPVHIEPQAKRGGGPSFQVAAFPPCLGRAEAAAPKAGEERDHRPLDHSLVHPPRFLQPLPPKAPLALRMVEGQPLFPRAPSLSCPQKARGGVEWSSISLSLPRSNCVHGNEMLLGLVTSR